jgi:hypothetical protein
MTVRLRGHHISNFAHYLIDGRIPQDNAMNRYNYGEEHIRRVTALYESLKLNPDTVITLIDAPDVVCDADCLYRLARDDCESAKLSALDREEIEAYGLQPGDVTSAELARRIEEFGETHTIEFGGTRKIRTYMLWRRLHQPVHWI